MTTNYGAEKAKLDAWVGPICHLGALTPIAVGGPGGVATQIEEMKFGARFLWDLDHKWLNKAPVNPGNILVVAGTASGVSDGIVRTASAALPEDFFLPVGHILYVPYQHCDVCGLSTPLVYVQDTSHFTYRIVKEFLRSGQPLTQSSLGYQPSNQILDDSLLLLRMVDKVTQTPIMPPPSIALNCLLNISPSPRPIRNTDSDAGTVTVVDIPASLWTCSVQVTASKDYLGTSINDITMFPGLPQVRAIELALRPDRTR